MRVLVCGSRDWTAIDAIEMALVGVCDRAHDRGSSVIVIDGDARGADRIAREVAARHGMTSLVFPADWKKHGRAAGPIRNQQMLDEGRPDLVLAFWKDKSRGTEDMIRRARKAGVEVKVVEI